MYFNYLCDRIFRLVANFIILIRQYSVYNFWIVMLQEFFTVERFSLNWKFDTNTFNGSFLKLSLHLKPYS
jgi:hypothetical protein